jgi:hypothetical protein
MRTTREAREEIVAELGRSIDRIALATACLGQAYELLDEATGDRLEGALFRPVQRAYARAKRTQAAFAGRVDLPVGAPEQPSAGLPSQGVKRFVERGGEAAADADRVLAELQDSMLPIEAGDAELRAGLAEVRELLAEVPAAVREFLRTFGR